MMRSKKKGSSFQRVNQRWMTTFTDLTLIVLVFFVLLFSMSQIDVMKFRTLAESFANRNILDFYPSIIPGEAGTEHDQDEETDEIKNLEDLLEDIQGYLEKSGLEDVVVAKRTERGVVLILQEQVLFETGKAEILHGSNEFLDKVGDTLKQIPHMVKVEGHTDDRPINTYRYPSNWDLSTARSSSVIRYLTGEHDLDRTRFIAVGYGDTRPVAPNTSPENWEKNRRVEIVILDPAFTDDEILDS